MDHLIYKLYTSTNPKYYKNYIPFAQMSNKLTQLNDIHITNIINRRYMRVWYFLMFHFLNQQSSFSLNFSLCTAGGFRCKDQ